MKTLIICLCVFSLLSCNSQEMNKSHEKKEIINDVKKDSVVINCDYLIKIWNKLNAFDSKISDDDIMLGGDSIDSLLLYNKRLVDVFHKIDINKLTKEEIKNIKDSTSIDIIQTNEENIKIFSWSIYTYALEHYNISIGFINGFPTVLSSNTESDDDFGFNGKVDSIIEIKKNETYAFLWTNKCGQLCVINNINIFSIKNNKFIQCQDIFSDNKQTYSDINFTYSPNEDIKIEPKISYKSGTVTCPIISDDGYKVVGKATYKIVDK